MVPTRCRIACGDLSVDSEGVVEIVRQVTVLEADLDRAGLHGLAVVVVAVLVVAGDDFHVPAGLRNRLCGNEAFRQFDLDFVRCLTVATHVTPPELIAKSARTHGEPQR